MKLSEAPFKVLCKMGKSYYFDKDKIENIEQFEVQLTDFIYSGAYIQDDNFIEARHLVAKTGKIKIEIYSNEHPPAHFHITANGNKASLAIDDCRVLENSGFDNKSIKNIQDWFIKSKNKLVEVWNKTRPDDCVVGRI
ncbi:DUF4160 domain-containing protein [Halarcobacter ebronensis]|uniref:DUF4160 domain-containing protein n=1 Tax=Halarcobacter ebronensis TaxID=1462615 RepID=UPI003C792976